MMPATPGGVGSLCDGLPAYVYDPPIETVVFGWGVAEDGQLGLDTDANVLSPKVVEALLGTRFAGRQFGRSPLIAGSRNTLAISADGEVYSWGWNARATLGQGHRDHQRKPRRIPGLDGVAVVQTAVGGWHALALDGEGGVWAWGGNEYSQCGDIGTSARDIVTPTRCLQQRPVRQVAAGGMHSLVLTDNGEIWTWGEPWGDFSMTIDRSPRRIDGMGVSGGFARIACGAFHNLALSAQGELYTWGINDFGQLGNGGTSYATEPCRIEEGLEGVMIADVAAGGWHSLGITTEGELYVWGRGEYGRLGLGDSGSSKLRPTRVKSLEGVRVVEGACGGTHTIVVTDDGRAFIWGRGAFGRLGTGDERDHYSPVEVKLPGGPERWRIISATAGGRHSFVLALPDNGHLEERHAAWLAQRSPVSVRRGPFAAPHQGSAEHLAAGNGSALDLQRSWRTEADDEGGSEAGAPAAERSLEGQRQEEGEGEQREEAASAGKSEAGHNEEAEEEAKEEEDLGEYPAEWEEEEEEEEDEDDAAKLVEEALLQVERRAAGTDESALESPGPSGLVGLGQGGVGPGAGSAASRRRVPHHRLSDSEEEDDEEGGGAMVRRAQSRAAATLHGLRDDLPGDRP